MFISSQKKKENIAEYLLYMWQIEDLIRAYKLDLNLIKNNIIEKYELSDEKKTELLGWYDQLIEMMRSENKMVEGHIQINNNIIIELTDIHNYLKNQKDPLYNKFYQKAIPIISELKSRQNNTIENEVEISFSFLYGILLLKLQQKEISKETSLAQTTITELLSLLAVKYKDYKSGELILE